MSSEAVKSLDKHEADKVKIDAKGRLEHCYVLVRNTLSEEKLVDEFEVEDKENVAQDVLDR